MVLTQFALTKTGFDPHLGIDMQITERARADGKPIEGLETVVDQLGVFDSRSFEEQTRFLLDSADDVPKLNEDLSASSPPGAPATCARSKRNSPRNAPSLPSSTTLC